MPNYRLRERKLKVYILTNAQGYKTGSQVYMYLFSFSQLDILLFKKVSSWGHIRDAGYIDKSTPLPKVPVIFATLMIQSPELRAFFPQAMLVLSHYSQLYLWQTLADLSKVCLISTLKYGQEKQTLWPFCFVIFKYHS